MDDISALRNVLTSHCVVLKKEKKLKKIKDVTIFPVAVGHVQSCCSTDTRYLLKNTALLLREQTVFTIKADEIDPSFFLCFSFGRPRI